MKLLHIDSSITGANSVTRELTALIVRQLAAANTPIRLKYSNINATWYPN